MFWLMVLVGRFFIFVWMRKWWMRLGIFFKCLCNGGSCSGIILSLKNKFLWNCLFFIWCCRFLLVVVIMWIFVLIVFFLFIDVYLLFWRIWSSLVCVFMGIFLILLRNSVLWWVCLKWLIFFLDEGVVLFCWLNNLDLISLCGIVVMLIVMKDFFWWCL